MIRWCEIDGIVFVLDLKSDVFSALNAQLSSEWIEYSRTGKLAQSVNEVLAERGWRFSDDAPKTPVPSTLSTVNYKTPLLRAVSCLTHARKNLRDRGLSETVDWAERHQAITTQRSLESALTSFRFAEGVLPNRKGDLDCLPRSLALFSMLRGYGFSVCHKIGLYRYPFSAHAWVECDGTKVLEREAPRDDGAVSAHHAPCTVIMKSV